MKLTLSTNLISTLILDGQAYLSSSSSRQSRSRRTTFVRSSASNDAAFSAFADSLDEEPEDNTAAEKPWQAKLEDLLDPKTNLADVSYTHVKRKDIIFMLFSFFSFPQESLSLTFNFFLHFSDKSCCQSC